MTRSPLQHDPRDLAPVGTFCVRIEQAHVGDGMLLVVGSERGIGGREIGDGGVEGWQQTFSSGSWQKPLRARMAARRWSWLLRRQNGLTRNRRTTRL